MRATTLGNRGRVTAAAVAAIVAGAASVSACSGGNSAKSDDAKLVTYTASDRQKKLEAAAKKEGHLTWYTSLAGDVDGQILAAFKKKYPYIKVDMTRAAENDIATKVEQEAKARKNSADVLEVTKPASLELQAQKIITPYYSPALASVPKRYQTRAGSKTVWDATDRISPISFGYNTKKLPKSAAPKTLDDLLAPSLKGKMAIESTTTGVRWVGSVLDTLGDAKGRAFLKRMSAQDVKVQAVSGSALMGLVARGEVTASPAVFQNHAAQQADSGAPVAWTPVGTVVANTGVVDVMKKAAHPAAAMLFADFLLGPDGQKLYEKAHYLPAQHHFAYKVWVPEANYPTPEKYGKAFDQWQSILQEDFGH